YYKYALPLHPPPLLSQQTALQLQQPRLQAQNPFPQPTQMPARQGRRMKCTNHVQQGQPSLQLGELPGVQEQLVLASRQQQAISNCIYSLIQSLLKSTGVFPLTA
ncbi:unnamed protein product, partial [Lepidochelys kempii]